MAENGGAEENRTLKAEEKEDRLSALPDPLIHHILSFLPSTREAIQTGILSKRWLNQWTFVSNLIFDFSGLFSDYSFKTIPLTTSTISSVVDRTLFLHQCSKIFKLHIIAGWFYECRYDPNYEDFIRSVVRKQAEELLLKFSDLAEIVSPEIFFLQPLLVKLQLSSCPILRTGELNWKSLKVLSIWNCYFADGVITGIVSGSPLLQSLEVEYCFFGVSPLAIASTSLKRLVLRDMDCRVDILCPNLLVFDGYCLGMDRQNFGWSDRVFEKFLSDSPLLELLDLENFEFSSVRIDSEAMKKLVFKGRISNEIAISCPHLEELCLSGSVQKIRLINLPSSVCVSLD